MNRVELVGRLTREPEMRMSQSGTGVVRFSLAVDRIRKVEGQPEADFITCIAFGKTAEFMANYLHKGYLISVEGRIQTGSYDNQQTGQKVYTTDVACDSVQNLTPRNASGAGDNANYQPQQNPYQQPQASADDYQNTLDISSDDLPF